MRNGSLIQRFLTVKRNFNKMKLSEESESFFLYLKIFYDYYLIIIYRNLLFL